MHVYVATSLDLNSPLGLLGSAEKKLDVSNRSNTDDSFSPFFILLTIVIGLVLLHLHRGVENREPNSNSNEVDQDEQDHPTGKLDHYFDGDQQLPHRTASHGGAARRRHNVACAFCGNLSTARCSRCKVARYCSVECQIRHWRSGHRDECLEADQAKHIHDHGTSILVEKSDKETIPNRSHGEWSSDVGVDASSNGDANNVHGCEECGRPSTTSCSRCKAVKYCSVKCLIMNWRWHKDHCIAGDVNSTPTERPNRDVGVLNNSYEEEENIHSSTPLSLEFHPEGTPNFESPNKASQDPTKEAQIHRTEWVKYLEDELVKYSVRKEILLLQSERDEWKNRATFARERFQSLKKEFEHQLFVLRNENESMSNAEKKACNAIHSLHEKLNHLQISVEESIAEKRRLEEQIQIVESGCAKLKKELREEHKRAQSLTLESNKSNKTAQIAIRQVEVLRQELQQEREHVQQLKENFHRDVIVAESRAAFAEAKLSDLHRKIRLTNYKACTICLTNEKDLAFGCGHMTCRDCGSKLSKCPICREQITSHIRLFPG